MVPITTRYRKRHVSDESNDNNADNEETTNTNQEGDLDKQRKTLMKKGQFIKIKENQKFLKTVKKI